MDPHRSEPGLGGLRLSALLQHFPAKPIYAVYVFINGFASIALMGGLAWLTGVPFVFPSLGPTAFLLFFTPMAPASSPRSAVLGHAVGIICGYGALLLFGLQDTPAAMQAGFDLSRMMAVALSLGATGGLMILLGVIHPPAGATTMIVSLGILAKPWQLATLELAVVALVAQAVVVNRLAGLLYPLWGQIATAVIPDQKSSD